MPMPLRRLRPPWQLTALESLEDTYKDLGIEATHSEDLEPVLSPFMPPRCKQADM
jgi:hypothetical protein